jgi:hypothetical protein
MTPEDWELLASLRRQQAELQQTLDRLNTRLTELECRAPAAVTPPPFPPLPPLPADVLATLPPLPPLAVDVASLPHPTPEQLPPGMPPFPNPVPPPFLPPLPPNPPPFAPAAAKKSTEARFGRPVIAIGAIFFIIGIVSLAAWLNTHLHIPAAGKLAGIGLVSSIVLAVGQYLERRRFGAVVAARTIMAAGLAGLYIMLYAACFEGPLRVIPSAILGGLLLLFWSAYVLSLSDRRRSEGMALFAITLAYLSTALNPVGSFTLAADLLLAGTAVVFLWRTGWTLVPTFAVVGTYLALLRRLIFDSNGQLILDTSRTLPFWPYALFLIFAWVIFTWAVIFTRVPSFRGWRRFAFLSLNNAAVASLLALTAYIAGYGATGVGTALLDTGLVFMITSRIGGFAEVAPIELMRAYAAQGVILFTAGLIAIFSGVTRAFVLITETFLFGCAGAFAVDRILIVNTYVAGAFATMFAIWEIAVYAHHPWLLGFGGGLIMFINAWACRGEIRESREARGTIVVSTSCFCILGMALVMTTLFTMLGDAALPPALCLAALASTFVIYYFTIYEFPPLGQIFLIVAQLLVLFPMANGEELPWWTTAAVIVTTLILVTWWSRQRTTRSGSWTIPLTYFYGLALVGLVVETVRPYLDAPQWMVAESLFAALFFVYGTVTRAWSVAVAGQLLLALAFYHAFFPPNHDVYPWPWWAAALPVTIIYATALSINSWTYALPELSESWRENLRLVSRAYIILAIFGCARLIFGLVTESSQVAALLLIGTFLLSMSVRRDSTFGVRCSFILSGLGMWTYLSTAGINGLAMATYLNGIAMVLFLSQAALLRHDHEKKPLVTAAESWALIVFSVLTNWIFVSTWVWTSKGPSHLTIGWAVFAFFLFLFGHLVRERRLRWCGLVVLLATFIRVFCYDFWGLSSGYRVLTFLLVAFIALGVGFILLRRETRETLF